ncbi:MAG TPA: hypothetical protein VGD63_17415 [Steroidobacteraceae bacterium]
MIRYLGGIIGGHDHIAAAAIHFVGKGERDGLSRSCSIEVRAQRHDARDPRSPARGQHAYGVTRPDDTLGYQPRKAAEVQVGAIDPLNGHSKRALLRDRAVDLDIFKMLHQGGAAVPRGLAGSRGDVVPGKARDRNCYEVADSDALGKDAVLGSNRLESALIVTDQIHFVDCQHEVVYAEKMSKIAVAARLGEHALARIDENYTQVRC